MRIFSSKYFLPPGKIGVDFDGSSLSLSVNNMNSCESYFNEGIRVRDVSMVNNYATVKIDFNIADFSNWAIILDEFLRLVAGEGKFSFYLRNSKFVCQHVCLSFLRKMFVQKNIQAKLIHVGPDQKGDLYIFDIKRQQSSETKKDWSIGILVDGKAPELLDAFLFSIDAEFNVSKHDQKLEVIVNGPTTKEYNEIVGKYDIDIRFINTGSDFNHLGWITQKKNAIVAESKYENTILFHNRYALKSGWLKKFDNFGYDFEILSPKQVYQEKRFPDWTAAGSEWSLAKSFLLDPNDFHPNLYVNGGVIIAKKWVLEKYSLNEFLFWNQAEDLSHTSELISQGILPRYASDPEVEVLSMRNNFMKGFKEQNKLCQAIWGYEQRISHFSPIYKLKDKIRRLMNA